MTDPFAQDFYLGRRKVLTLFTPKFHIYDQTQQLVAYVEQKAFRLKEDITVFSDEAKSHPLLRIQAQSIIDFSASYAVTDLRTDELAGFLQRKGFKSLVRDEWHIFDGTQQPLGLLREDSLALGLLRRLLSNLIPQSYHLEIASGEAGTIRQHFNPFIMKLDVDLRSDTGRAFDRRLAVAAAVLLMAIEGRQN